MKNKYERKRNPYQWRNMVVVDCWMAFVVTWYIDDVSNRLSLAYVAYLETEIYNYRTWKIYVHNSIDVWKMIEKSVFHCIYIEMRQREVFHEKNYAVIPFLHNYIIYVEKKQTKYFLSRSFSWLVFGLSGRQWIEKMN
jgi:hypothetical protein